MFLATALALAPPPLDPAHAALDRLAGCWDAPGEVLGKPVRTRVRGAWRLGSRYLLLEMHGLDPADPYDAAILLGDHDKRWINSWWMDSFGAGYSAGGVGEVKNGAIEVLYSYPDATYTNRLVSDGKGWRWTIVERKHVGGGEKAFASYRLTPMPCDDTRFAF
ncbi:hypothetical protein FHS95_002971 [Sphingomonas naasensis]|uniref:DUF1579 domain-containing protein n=1 Tax=Sphingomonas naasensis TaxID=1344951 RepID=A0A4S1WDF6_9SPHN|nr:hypothetical protein [Sphingomonas naasensis]NIJ21268.1 hypothetical protein [Sphingomonas naasensis]TGX38706.1 hypothetical protein E5A74_17890 [Sphingomonas naasensis]